jgi:transcriptional regulator with XRE-family HTH domain
MESSVLIRRARHRAGLTQRELAARAETSHSTLAAYESGSKVPRTDTLDRILRAAGCVPEVVLRPSADPSPAERKAKGDELWQALDLASRFPLRRRPALLPPPVLRPRTKGAT